MTTRLAVQAGGAAAGVVFAAVLLAGAASAVTDTVFRYTEPKNGWYNLSPGAFAPDNSGTTYARTSDFISGAGCYYAGVNLPQGAKMTGLAAWYSSDGAAQVQIFLRRRKFADGVPDTFALGSTDTTQTRVAMSMSLPQSAIATVNNQQYHYSANVCLNGTNDTFYGGRITYTYATAGD